MQNKDIIYKLSRFAYITSLIGICTLGICPSFGAIAVVVPCVLKAKKAKMDEDIVKTNKKSLIIGSISLALFVVDIIVLVVLNNIYHWF